MRTWTWTIDVTETMLQLHVLNIWKPPQLQQMIIAVS